MDVALELVRLIYDAAWAADGWPEFLSALRDCLGGVGVALMLRPPDRQDPGVTFAVGLAPEWLRALQDECAPLDPSGLWRLGYADGAVGLAEAVLPARELERTRFYNEWMRPQGLRPAPIVGGLIRAVPSAAVGAFWLRRSRSTADKALSVFQRLMPHWQHALRLHELLGDLTAQRTAAIAAFDRLTVGVVFLDGRGQVLAANRFAEGLICQEDGLRIRRGRLVAADIEEATRLHGLLAAAISSAAGRDAEAPRTMTISRPSGLRPFVVRTQPVYRETSPLWVPRAITAVFITDTEQHVEPDVVAVRRLYHLTAAEAKLALCLAQGLTLKEAAEQLQVRFNTARAHLRQIFEKTGVRHQGALVRLLLTSLRA